MNKMHVDMGEIENEPVRPKITDAKGILQQNREFLDFFWDIAKPEQEIRLKAIENLIQYLKTSEKTDELTYTLNRLVDGLAHTREAARPGFSLALGQVLSVFEEVPLHTAFDQIKEKHNLAKVKKKLIRNAAFGNFFGVLALSQSTRLPKEPQVVLECVQLLQSLSQYREHLRDLPRKTMVDILSETSEEVFEEVLLGALQTDLSSAFSTPEQLQLLLVAMQKFPQVLKPKKLKKLLGTSTIITMDNIPKLTDVLKMAARSVKKDRLLPAVALDLLQISLREDNFELFWRETIINGMLKDQPGPTHYLSYRLLGSALPLLTLAQLKQVLNGEVMRTYGEHVVSAQLPDRFKFAPEMETYVGDFLQGCDDPEKQLAVMVAFSLLTNQGYPVVPSFWRVVHHLQPTALQSYVDWLKDMFLNPRLDSCLDFSTRRQKENQEGGIQRENCIFRLRKWIIPRLTSIAENNQVKREEALVMDVARFVFFHAFFNAKKATPDILETEATLSVPLDEKTRAIIINSFFGLLQHINHLPLLGNSPEVAARNQRHMQGVMADGSMWIFCLVRYADTLLNQPKYAQSTQPFSPEQRQAWDSMLASVWTLMKKSKKGQTPETSAFQQLFLLVGIHLFKAPEDLVDLMQDLQNCMEKAQEKKSKKKKAVTGSAAAGEEEPHWAEVVVDILLSLLSQPSRHIRHVCRTVFSNICPHVTARALTAILDVLDPDKDEEDSSIVVTDDKDKIKKKDKKKKGEDEDDEEMNEDESDASDDDSDEGEGEAMEEGSEVDQNFRIELMKVLQNQGALATEEDGSDDDELDDEAMMKLDGSIAGLFLEQKKKMQAKKDEKDKLKKEKTLVRDFKIKVLDLVEVFLARQGSSPLVLGMVEPLLSVIESGMSSESDQQEQDFLRKAADIFKNQLCRAKQYCKTVGDRQGELHDLLEKLMTKTQKLSDSSVSLYFFSASLYLVKVLRGGAPGASADGKTTTSTELRFMGNVDVERVSAIFKGALCSFMTRRKSPLSGLMFVDLFTRFPVLCVNLLVTAVEHITTGVREHQQSQASAMVLRGLQSREVQQLLAGNPWAVLLQQAVGRVAASLETVVETGKNKVVQEKLVKALELGLFLVKTVNQQKLSVDLEPLKKVLQSMREVLGFRKTGQMEDTYWAVMKHFGVIKPKRDRTRKTKDQAEPTAPKKKKGFLPETKKRKNRKKQLPVSEQGAADANTVPLGKPEGGKKKRNKIKRKLPGGGETPGQGLTKKAKTTQPEGKQKKGGRGE
ncbi:myb-binding protein 1A-like protein isoform X1 [Oncorhynchus kisutch]|uniref:MYB binding protein (P160) 1a n=2 Tax=Oncorhynchus kisutch TaxID=8019 RepID=A0A8C7KXV9_ONCKI|nr:myb-binding protein 1A-like protein isoform X1 [Oncorhynchus kisutch]